MRQLLFHLLLLTIILPLTGQQGVAGAFQRLGKEDGLSQTSVFAIAQDSLGFLWFGTRDGLNRFDGYEFEVFRHDPEANSLVNNDIRGLYVDPLSQDLWVATLAGLSRFDQQREVFENFSSGAGGLSSSVIRCVYRDRAGRLWVGTSSGLNLFDPDQRTFHPFFPPRELAASIDVEALAEDHSGRLLVGSTRGLYAFTAGDAPRWEKCGGMGDLHITALEIDPDTTIALAGSNIWVGTNGAGVWHYNSAEDQGTGFQHEATDPTSLSNNNVRCLAIAEVGDLWVGTFEGINFLERGQRRFLRYLEKHTQQGGLLDHSIRSLLVDRSGTLWTGTYYGGVHHLDERYNFFTNFRRGTPNRSISANVISSFAEDEGGNFWIGTEGGGLNYFDVQSGRFEYYRHAAERKNSLSGRNVKELLLEEDHLWIGTFRAGLNRLDIANNQFVHYRHDPRRGTSLANDNVYGLLRKDGRLWVATYGGGLDIMPTTEDHFLHYAHDPQNASSISSNLVRLLFETADGQIWAGTERGLNRVLLGGDGLPQAFEQVLDQEKIYSIAADEGSSPGGLWVGTFGNGLYRLDTRGAIIDHYTTVDGLPGNTIFGILWGRDRTLWLSTSDGLSRLDLATGVFTNFDESNGLANLEYNFNAYYRSKDGMLLFGGLNGFTYFDPNTLPTNRYVPPVVFTGLQHRNKPVKVGGPEGLLSQNINATEEVVFAYNDANFTLGFAALDYFSPENNRYAYQLEGLEPSWNYVIGQHEVTYNIQREGEYVFLLRAGNSDGHWNDTVRRLRIRVLPPPWRSWWAYLLYLMAAGGIIYAIVRFLRLRDKLRLREMERRQQDELLETKLRFFTNITHEFRTPLTLILGPLRQLLATEEIAGEQRRKLRLINSNAGRLLNLVNQVLTFRKLDTDHEPLRGETADLVAFLMGIGGEFREPADDRNIRLEFDSSLTRAELWFDADKLERVFYNLLSNAFKFTPDGGRIRLSLRPIGEGVEVVVADSGRGIDPEARRDIFKRFYEKSTGSFSSVKNSGIGLAISRQMIELHGGTIEVGGDNHPCSLGGATFVVHLGKSIKRQPAPAKAVISSTRVVTSTDGTMMTNEVAEINEPPCDSTRAAVEKTIRPTNQDQQPAASAEQPNRILVVEDNPEIQEYLKEIFGGNYRVLTANNGLEGLERLRKQLPDLIVSDVMMPEMDGIAFCQAVKSDDRTAHIPVILLTARAADPFKLEGLRTGADDYLTKPFDPEELRLRVRNMIAAHRVTKSRFGKVLSLEPREIEVTTEDEAFLKKVVATMEQHIADADFSVEDFARALVVSRSLMFEKVKLLTGMTPNKLLRSFRLKRAAQLLVTSDYRISQIADLVGFRDSRYFRKCFKNEFGSSPAKFRSEEEEE